LSHTDDRKLVCGKAIGGNVAFLDGQLQSLDQLEQCFVEAFKFGAHIEEFMVIKALSHPGIQTI
jgi:hypothetical protein